MAENSGEEKKSPLLNRKSLLFIVPFALLLLAAVGLTAYFALNQDAWKDLVGKEQNASRQNGTQSGSESASLGPLVKLDNFVVNITDGERSRYLKASITLEAINSRTKKEIESRKPQIRDAVLFLASNKDFRELRDLQGKKQLQAELQQRINSLLSKGEIRRIFFTEFVIQ